MAKNKRQQVIETGKRLFLQQGIAATSMEEIAEKTPVSKMTIYNYFRSKEGLVERIVEQWTEDSYRQFRSVMDKTADPLEALGLFYKGADLPDRDISDVFLRDLQEQFPHLLARLMAFHQERIVPEFEAMIFKGQQMGQIRKDISPHVLMMFLSFMKEFAIKSGAFAGTGSLNSVGEQLTTILYYGIIHPDYKQ